jgi:hypothetical protein
LESRQILQNLKELTLDLAAGKRSQAETVLELHRRIEGALVYDMDAKDPLREFITQVYVSLENLTAEDFPPSAAEMQYFVECFEGKREFNLAEVREFAVDSKVEVTPNETVRRANKKWVKKPIGRPNPQHQPKSGKINP